MPKETLVEITNAGYTQITSQIPSRRVELCEDGQVAPQGFLVQTPDDGFTATREVGPTVPPQTYVLGNTVAHAGGAGTIIGHPAQVYRAADVYCQVKSAGGPTVIRVREIE